MTRQGETHAEAVSRGLNRYLWLLWVIWLAFLAYPVQALAHAHAAPLRVTVVLSAAAVFAVVYTWNILHALRQLRTGTGAYSPWPAIAVLIALALGLTLGDRRDWVELFIFVIVSLGPSLPPKRAILAIGLFVLLAPLLGLVIGAGTIQMAQMVFQSGVSGIAVIIVGRVIVLDRELRLARDEIARLAVSEERLRFARDLHDLLGHSLSLIAVKSELAGKLAAVAPERAAAEMRDVETAARSSLQEVREAVAGYRQPTLARELESAREILAAAGIAFQCEEDSLSLPASAEIALSWAVREGVTNVIKHSGARCCTVRVALRGNVVVVEVKDDGRGAATHGEKSSGSGLAGIAERVAALGGRFEAGPQPCGFRLAVFLPVDTQGQATKGEILDVVGEPA